jgi:hexosaminidase
VQARIRELGLADETALQGWFVARIGRFLDARGRRLIGWDEILESGIPQRAGIMSWRGTAGGVAAARAGHDVVMAPAPILYLDYLQSDSAREPPGRPAVVTLEDVYRFEPVPEGLTADEASRILGAQLNAWTEHMRLPERLEQQAFPRVAALAEATWSPVQARDFRNFQSRLAVQFARYRMLGIRYSDTAFEPRFEVAPGADADTARVALARQAEFGTMRLARDGQDPGPSSTAYERAFDVPFNTVLKAASFDGVLPLSAPVALTVGARALNRRGSEALAHCSGNLTLRLEDDAPLAGERAIFTVDIVDPCWVWRGADLTRGRSLRASVGQLPFNFQIGKDADAIRRGDARTQQGELEVRIGDCAGEPVARIPIGSAASQPELSLLGPVRIPPQGKVADLCLRFARPAIDPIWAIDWVELGE